MPHAHNNPNTGWKRFGNPEARALAARPGPVSSVAPRRRRARRSFGHVLDDQHGRFVLTLVADVDDAEAATAELDHVARVPDADAKP
jgi:hypothetical protein